MSRKEASRLTEKARGVRIQVYMYNSQVVSAVERKKMEIRDQQAVNLQNWPSLS